jgi:hypothetical protein
MIRRRGNVHMPWRSGRHVRRGFARRLNRRSLVSRRDMSCRNRVNGADIRLRIHPVGWPHRNDESGGAVRCAQGRRDGQYRWPVGLPHVLPNRCPGARDRTLPA